VNAFTRTSLLTLPVLLLACAACGGGGESTVADEEQAAVFARDGPLSAVAITDARVDGARPALEPRLALTSAKTSVHGVVLVGDGVRAGSQVTFSWFRIEGGGSRRESFTHRIAAPRGGGGVVSEGVASGGLAPGIYETVVTLGTHRVHSYWFVTAASTRSLSAARRDAATESALEGGATESWGDDADDPFLGASEPPPEQCTLDSLDAFSFFLDLTASLHWSGPCESVSLAAAAGGTPRTFDSVADPSSDYGTLGMDEYVCLIPGGSDVPGTVFRVVGTAAGAPAKEVLLTLPDRGEEFHVQYESVPPIGARVRAGDVIRINAVAARLPPALGIKVLYLDDGTDLIDSTGNIAGTSANVPCRGGQGGALLPSSAYRVPENPPPLVEICAYSEGFDGETREFCGSFPTGEAEVWQGTWDGGFHVPPPCTPPVWEADGTVSFTVAADGTLAGEARITNEPGTCGGTGGPGPTPAGGTLTGRRTDDGFALELVLPGLGRHTIPLARAGNEATGELSLPLAAGARYEVALKLRCTTCS
jgi:hypothetical protein